MANNDGVNAIMRAFSVLDLLFQSSEPMGISNIAAELKLPKASVFRILNTLAQCKAVHRDSNDHYSLGIIFLRYAEHVKSNISLLSLASPILSKLRDATGETTNLGVLFDNFVLNIQTMPGDSFIITSRTLPLAPLHCSAMGKIFLSYMQNEEIEAYFEKPYPKRTINTITTVDEFYLERNRIVSAAISHDREEYEYGLYCIGAPIFSQTQAPVAAISITGPTSRMSIKGIDQLSSQIAQAAAQLTALVIETNVDLF